jgi:putative protein kinase ArgK-like GTPase of G3E family
LAVREDAWQPPIVKTVATESKGIEELAAAIGQSREFQRSRRKQATAPCDCALAHSGVVAEQLVKRALDDNGADELLDRLAAEVATKRA